MWALLWQSCSACESMWGVGVRGAGKEGGLQAQGKPKEWFVPSSSLRWNGRGTPQKSLPAETEAAGLGASHSPSGFTVPPPQHDPSCSPGRQYLHGAQGHQLHEGVCSNLVDLVVLETTGKTETALRRELKAAFLLYGDLCPDAADADCHSGSCCAWETCSYLKS